MIIIGITGTLGAGKGTIAEYLIERKGFVHYSVRGFITEEINRRALPVNRDSMVLIGNELREKNSPSYIVDCLFERAKEVGQNAIIESIRTPGEAESLRKKEGARFCLLAVDADPKIRYERVYKRGSATDGISYEKFIAQEQLEMTTTDPNKQNLSRCIEMADYLLDNSSTVDELYSKLEEVLAGLG